MSFGDKYRFSQKSRSKLKDVHPDLVKVVIRAMSFQVMDFSILEGLRSFERQQSLVRKGASKTLNSKHLKQNDGFSHAIDIAPYPIDWQDHSRFYILNGLMRAAASLEGVKIRTGADWDSDSLTQDQSFHDLPHYEIT